MLHSISTIYLALLCLCFIALIKGQGKELYEEVNVAISEAISRSMTNFALDLMQKISTDYHKTILFSPLSIMSTLAMIMLGSKGRSFKELSELFGQKNAVVLHRQLGLMLKDVQQPMKESTSPLRNLDRWHNDSLSMSFRSYPTDRRDYQEVHVASGLFIQQGHSINPNYRQALTLNYKSGVYPLDFEDSPFVAKNIINSWVSYQTKGKITEIITDEIDVNTRILITNTLHFKAMWEIDFLGGESKKHTFYPNGVGTQPELSIDVMVGIGAYPYYKDTSLNCHIIGIPYHGNMTTMYVIQPLESSADNLLILQEILDATTIEGLISKMRRVSSTITFPKMHITETTKLRTFLESLGISGIFNPVQYDLSLMVSPDPNVYHPDAIGSIQNLDIQRVAQSNLPSKRADLIVSEIVHKVDLNIDEKGTEEAAAAPAAVSRTGPEVNFLVETSFLLLVRNDVTKLPLFYGAFNEPPSKPSSYE